jgi:hypothetical protein
MMPNDGLQSRLFELMLFTVMVNAILRGYETCLYRHAGGQFRYTRWYFSRINYRRWVMCAWLEILLWSSAVLQVTNSTRIRFRETGHRREV